MKKTVALLLAAMLLLSLAACGGKTSSGSNDTPSTNQSSPNNTEITPSDSGETATNTEIENRVDLSLDKAAYEIDEHIAVTLDFSKLNQETAVIIVVNSDTAHGKAIPPDDDTMWVEYRWLADFSEVPFYLYPQNTGNGLYDVRIYADAEGGEELASATIAIGSAVLPAGSGNAGNTGTGDCTQKQMEDTIVSYLSKISDMSSLTLGGGSRIEYTKADDALNDFDFWTIYDPELDNDAMYEAMNSQLAARGFSYEKDLVGRHVWYREISGEHTGILFWPDDDEMPDGYYILMMTQKPEAY